jgi:hypothetical protein
MSGPLANIPLRLFQGVIPATIATSSANGVPNVTYLSQVHRIDDSRVALSCQFFNKTKQNVLANPYATVGLLDPVSMEWYRLELRYDHAETEGPLFEAMDLRINAIASHTGMTGIFKLISADVYEVMSAEFLEAYLDVDKETPIETVEPRSISEIRGLQLLSQRTSRARDLEELMSSTLSTLDEAFGFEHAMILMLDETGSRLYTVATRGYQDEGVGAEIAVGEGLIGAVARQRRVLRMSGVEEELRYGRAIRSSMQKSSGRRGVLPEVPLPGLVDAQSYMAMPLVIGDRLLGVVAVESRAALAFDEWDETYLEIIANQVAVAVDNMLLREREPSSDASEPRREQPRSATSKSETCITRLLRFFKNDDCLFIGDDYLIRNVPARILWRILREHRDRQRCDFSNRELRLDPWLGLPAFRDNLESRLVLLRKRLAEKCPEIRLVPTDRGRFRLELDCSVELEEREGA